VLTAIGELAQPAFLPLLKMVFPEISNLLSVCMIDMFKHMRPPFFGEQYCHDLPVL
jgi:hypothetical protein